MNNIIKCTVQVKLIFLRGISHHMPWVLPLRVVCFKPDNYFFKSTMTHSDLLDILDTRFASSWEACSL